MTQTELFAGAVRASDPDTSLEAARKITGRTEQRILDVFTAGTSRFATFRLTDDDLCEWVKAYPPTVKSARSRLSNKGILVDSGERRPSNTGSPMIVWKLGPVPETE